MNEGQPTPAQLKRIKGFLSAFFYIRSMRVATFLPVFFGLLIFSLSIKGQQKTSKGKLFIIGGGDRPPSLMNSLLKEAAIGNDDYAVVLPMSGENPDTSFYYFKADWDGVSDKKIFNLNFTSLTCNNKLRLDSLKKAKLIFITGGDQDRFMNIVLNTPIYSAIHEAYQNGATIAGTSAGAAVMSKQMITGNQLTDTVYRSTFPRLVAENIEFKTGLGLLTNAIIDQHFIVRSRYNRLFSAIAAFPMLTCIGIDEETAIIVQGNKVRVSGSSQVVVIRNISKLEVTEKKRIKFKDIRFSIYTDGDEFFIVSNK
jgi:cyanophycinase